MKTRYLRPAGPQLARWRGILCLTAHPPRKKEKKIPASTRLAAILRETIRMIVQISWPFLEMFPESRRAPLILDSGLHERGHQGAM